MTKNNGTHRCSSLLFSRIPASSTGPVLILGPFSLKASGVRALAMSCTNEQRCYPCGHMQWASYAWRVGSVHPHVGPTLCPTLWDICADHRCEAGAPAFSTVPLPMCDPKPNQCGCLHDQTLQVYFPSAIL